ncbi:hypothetical protein [Haloarcula marismortui]|nr:hypothetical protein [Haloarcula californiae]
MGRYEHPARDAETKTSREWGSIQLAYALGDGARISADGDTDE